MAITTYAELQAAAANWLVRGDLTARIPEFIALAEARLNRVLRARLMETEAALTTSAGSKSAPLPAGFGEPVALWLVKSEGRMPLRFMERSLIGFSSLRGEPACWTVDGSAIVFERPCDAAYSLALRMLTKAPLSDAAPTNAILAEAPDAYLFATLCEAAPFLRDAELAAAYEARLERAVAELNAKEARSRAGQRLGVEPALRMGGGAC